MTHRGRQDRRLTLSALCFMALLAAGCTRDYPPQEKGPASEAAGEHLAVVIRLPGDDFAGQEELSQRDSVARRIEAEGLGQVVLRGTGMGSMEVVFRVASGGDVHPRISEIMMQEVPGRPYVVEERREPLQPPASPAQ